VPLPEMPTPRLNQLRECLRLGRFAVTAEIVPPVSSDSKDLIAKALPLRGAADAVNVTDGAGARAHMGSLAAAVLLLQSGVEPILQFTCRDRNRIALQSDLLAAGAMGIENSCCSGVILRVPAISRTPSPYSTSIRWPSRR
jgi:methylenetetrahydrofolate reductase (NADPH)